MKNKLFFLVLGIIFIAFSTYAGRSQTSDNETKLKRFEIGGQFTVLRRTDANTSLEIYRRSGAFTGNPGTITELGLGGRLTFNFTKNIAVEAEANFFPEDKRANPVTGVPLRVLEPGGRKFQAVVGPKIGFRARKFGVFGKIRPGLFSMDRYDVVQFVSNDQPPVILSAVKKGVNFFNIDVGGVFEYYPSKRTIFRVDAGDTIINYSSQEPKNINPNIKRNNLQISVGFGFRF